MAEAATRTSICTGACCHDFPINDYTTASLVMAGGHRPGTELHQISKMVVPLHFDRYQHFTCKFFDKEAGLCTSYPDRPAMCSEYPYTDGICRHCGYSSREAAD